jgi:hypothetical protein
MKLYLVWNEAKTECVGFVDIKQARYAFSGESYYNPEDMGYTVTADNWLDNHMGEQCTITEIEV